MFYPHNDYVIRDMVKQKHQAFLREAETNRLHNEMKRQKAGWLSQHTSWLLRLFARRRRPAEGALCAARGPGTASRLQTSGRGS